MAFVAIKLSLQSTKVFTQPVVPIVCICAVSIWVQCPMVTGYSAQLRVFQLYTNLCFCFVDYQRVFIGVECHNWFHSCHSISCLLMFYVFVSRFLVFCLIIFESGLCACQ